MRNFNNGILVEYSFVKALNSKRYCELEERFKKLIDSIFLNVKCDDMIYCFKNDKEQKSDIFISCNNEIRGISIKTGHKNSMHVERISDFISFLITNNVDRQVIIEYLRYQYGDGTTNGTGCARIGSNDYKEMYQDRIDYINDNINVFPILEKAIDRFILKGRNSDIFIDGIIYGDTSDFVFIKRDDIKNIILSKIDSYSTGVHLGCLSIQPLNRCLNYNKTYDYARFLVQIKWYNIFNDYKDYFDMKEAYEYNRL